MNEKVSINDVKDRLEDVKQKNTTGIEEMIQNLIVQDPFDGLPFYIFAHKRTIGMDERYKMWIENPTIDFKDIPDMKILWQTRLTKPQAQENSMLYKVDPKMPEQVKIIWILPEREKFHLYKSGKFFQDQLTAESIHDYIHDKQKLEAKEPDDLDDLTIRKIYASKAVTQEAKRIANVFKRVRD